MPPTTKNTGFIGASRPSGLQSARKVKGDSEIINITPRTPPKLPSKQDRTKKTFPGYVNFQNLKTEKPSIRIEGAGIYKMLSYEICATVATTILQIVCRVILNN